MTHPTTAAPASDAVSVLERVEKASLALESVAKLLNTCGPYLQGVGQECCGQYEADYGGEYMGQREVVPVCCGHPIDLSDHVANELGVIEGALIDLCTLRQQMQAARTELHKDIINLPCNPPAELTNQDAGVVFDEGAYSLGHRDARHAAAELVQAASPSAQPVRMQINLTEEQAGALRDLLSGSDEPPELALSVGDGHSGYGLYAWEAEYPEEGATFIAALGSSPSAQPTDHLGLRPSAPGFRQMTEREREAGIWSHYVGPVESACPESATCAQRPDVACFCRNKDAASSPGAQPTAPSMGEPKVPLILKHLAVLKSPRMAVAALSGAAGQQREDARDAARYRWLRDKHEWYECYLTRTMQTKFDAKYETLDAAIDSAMSQEQRT